MDERRETNLRKDHTGSISSVVFSPDGTTLASASGGKVRLWDIDERKQVDVLNGNSMAISVDFSPDGRTLASGGYDGTIHLWDAENGKQVGLLLGHAGWNPVNAVAFSPDGQLLASGSSDGTVRFWDVEKEKQVNVLQGHRRGVYSVAFSPDGRILAWSGHDNKIWLWDVEKQVEIGVLEGERSYLYCIAFSPDGRLLASGGGHSLIYLWDVQAQKQVGVLEGHEGEVKSIVFSHDGKMLVSGGYGSKVRFWDIQRRSQIGELHTSGAALAFSSDWGWLAVGTGGVISLWDTSAIGTPRPVEPRTKQPATWGKVKITKLLQNFPNPFNPETWIPFSLSESERVIIRIYNSTGRLVRTLDLGEEPPGAYFSRERAAYWDGKNQQGESLGSGVYFYQLVTDDDFSATKKMFVVR